MFCKIYYILWPDCMSSTGMWSPNGDQSGQWRLISMKSQWPLIMTSQWVMMLLGMHIVKSQWVMTLLGTSIVMSQWVMMLLCVHIMASQLGMYSFTIFCSRYCQLIIAILTIISVIVDQCDRNISAATTWPISNTKECVRGLAHPFVLEIGQVMIAPNWKQYYARLFSKVKTKQDDEDAFWWIFGHVSLSKLEKYVEDDNC